VERWYVADPAGLSSALGASVKLPQEKCERDVYKRLLVDAREAAGHMIVLGGAELADEIVRAMDLYRAGRNDAALKAFVSDLRGVLRT
jgi:hypothetical protein